MFCRKVFYSCNKKQWRTFGGNLLLRMVKGQSGRSSATGLNKIQQNTLMFVHQQQQKLMTCQTSVWVRLKSGSLYLDNGIGADYPAASHALPLWRIMFMDHNCNEQTSLLACKPFFYIHVDSFKTITGGHTAFFFGVNDEGYLGRSWYDVLRHMQRCFPLWVTVDWTSSCAVCWQRCMLFEAVLLYWIIMVWLKKKKSFHSCLKFRKVEGLELK